MAKKKTSTKKKATKKTEATARPKKQSTRYAKSGAHVQAAEDFNPKRLTPSMFMSVNQDMEKPTWKKEKYPLKKATYNKLVAKAAHMEPRSMKALDATQDKAGDIDGMERIEEIENFETSEDGTHAGGRQRSSAPNVVSSFEGIPASGWNPPDCNIAVSDDHIVAAVNSEFRVYNKAGAELTRHLLGTFFSKVVPSGAKVFDPRLIFDHYNQRFVLAVAATLQSPQKSWLGMAVSKTTDPTGSWHIYAMDASLDGENESDNWMDYPMLGFDAHAIYISMNQFKFNGGFSYAKLRILNKSELYAGESLKYFDFWNLKHPDNNLAFTIQPCCHFRGNGYAAAYGVSSIWPGGKKLAIWELKNPLGHWNGGTPTLECRWVDCAEYDLPPSAMQKGTSERIATNDARLLNAVYQYAGGVKRLWTTHTVKQSWTGDSEARSAVRWYEIDMEDNKVVQQNSYGAKGQYYFFPAIQIDKNRDAYIVFGRSSENAFPELRQTGRRVDGELNDMENSKLIQAGTSANFSQRWGDYFGICRDPRDADSIWGFGQFAKDRNQWGTKIFNARY